MSLRSFGKLAVGVVGAVALSGMTAAHADGILDAVKGTQVGPMSVLGGGHGVEDSTWNVFKDKFHVGQVKNGAVEVHSPVLANLGPFGLIVGGNIGWTGSDKLYNKKEANEVTANIANIEGENAAQTDDAKKKSVPAKPRASEELHGPTAQLEGKLHYNFTDSLRSFFGLGVGVVSPWKAKSNVYGVGTVQVGAQFDVTPAITGETAVKYVASNDGCVLPSLGLKVGVKYNI